MNLYFDLDTKQLVKPPGESGQLRSVSFIRGDSEPMEVHFRRNGADVTDVTNIIVGIKSAPGAAAPTLAICQTWTLVDSAYVGFLNLNGEALNTLIAAKLAIGQLFEVTCFQAGKGPITAAAVKCTVTNDLWRGGEATPSQLPDPAAWMPAPLILTAAPLTMARISGMVLAGVARATVDLPLVSSPGELASYQLTAGASVTTLGFDVGSGKWIVMAERDDAGAVKSGTWSFDAPAPFGASSTAVIGDATGAVAVQFGTGDVPSAIGQLAKVTIGGVVTWYKWTGTTWQLEAAGGGGDSPPTTSATDLTSGTLAAERIADGSLPIAKTIDLRSALDGKVPTTRTINGNPLSGNITLTPSDIGIDENLINVKAYGAIGDGVTDDTAAVQDALNALEASGSINTLYFPKGKYRLNTHVANTQTTTALRCILTLGTTSGLDGRDIEITGEPGATLYSTTSPTRANILLINARMRSLRVVGMRFEKDAVLMAPTSAEPNGVDGVSLVRYDAREIDNVTFDDNTFFNCHGAVRDYKCGGNNLWGKIRTFEFTRNRVLNPYGSNVVADVTNEYGGGQQLNISSWVGTALIEGNEFLGSADVCDPVTNPEGTLKDGSFFGNPLRLIFKGNSVNNFAIETVYQTPFAERIGYTSSVFTVPENDGVTTVTFTVRDYEDSSYAADDRISVYNGIDVTVELIVTDWNAGTRTITAKNSGHSSNKVPGTSFAASSQVYVSGVSIASAVISGNTFNHSTPLNADILSSGQAIVFSGRAVVTANTIVGYGSGIVIYEEAHTPALKRARGSVISSNNIDIVAPDRNPSAWSSNGILIRQSNILVQGNSITVPFNKFSQGVRCFGKDCQILDNSAISLIPQVNAISADYSVAFAEGAVAQNTIYRGNYSSGWDAGIGPDAKNQTRASATVISHQSVGDVVAIAAPYISNYPIEGAVPTVTSNGLQLATSGGNQIARKLVAEAKAIETLGDDSNLKFVALPNRSYFFRASLLYTAATTGGGIKVKLNLPVSASFYGNYSVTVGGVAKFTQRRMLNNTTIATNDAAASGECVITIEGILITYGTGGDTILQWARNTSHTDPTTLQAGSTIMATMGM
jgi:hypothetical protein